MKTVRSGEVYIADLEPVRGSEQGRRRPVIVLQNPALSRRTTTAISIPLTTNMKRIGHPGTCFIKKGEGGLVQDGVALAFQMRSLDTARLGRRLGALSSSVLEQVADAALDALGITVEP